MSSGPSLSAPSVLSVNERVHLGHVIIWGGGWLSHVHYQMVSTEIRLIILFAAKDGQTLYSQKQDLELTVAQIISSFFAKFSLRLKKVGKNH